MRVLFTRSFSMHGKGVPSAWFFILALYRLVIMLFPLSLHIAPLSLRDLAEAIHNHA
ncbi:hypothetical protein [Helicobacter rodentium]|uniref:hypothetical protein n=1 Tax=Helicobacter rodentium TaxID=59617 RepID=UPI000A621F3F|nr:hypothetical protein [Helicobacter rodentium]